MLGELLSDPRQRRSALLTLLGMLTLAIVLISFGIAFPDLSILLVLGILVVCTAVALMAKLVITSHVHLRGTASRLIALNDRYDATERWLERFDADARSSFEATAAMHAELKARIDTLSVTAERLGDRLKELEGSAASRSELETVQKALQSELGAAIKSSAAQREQLEAQTRQLGVALDAATAASTKALDESKKDLVSSMGRLESSIKGLEAQLVKGDEYAVQQAVTRAEEAIKRVEKELTVSIAAASEEHDRKRESTTNAAKQEVHSALTEVTKSFAAKAEESASRVRTASSLLGRLRGDGYVQFSRILTGEAEKQLSEFGVTTVPAELRYLERKLHVVEGLCEGRLAGSTDDAVARALVARLFKGDELRILEIGVLFGVGSIFMHHALNPFYKSVHLTLLDPFDGYYGSDHLDPLTGQPVSLAAVERNLLRCGVPSEDVTVVPAFSTDDDALALVRERAPFGAVIIDGDHSGEGIKQDFERYADLVAPGGVLIVDDYGSEDWPAVTDYTDAVIESDSRFERVALIGKTVAYRRKPSKAAAKLSKASTQSEQRSTKQQPAEAKAEANASSTSPETNGEVEKPAKAVEQEASDRGSPDSKAVKKQSGSKAIGKKKAQAKTKRGTSQNQAGEGSTASGAAPSKSASGSETASQILEPKPRGKATTKAAAGRTRRA